MCVRACDELSVCVSAVDVKSGKVLVESEGFMNALSTLAAKKKEKKVKKNQGRSSKVSRTNSTSSLPDTKQATSSKDEEGSELTEGVCTYCM